MKTFQTEERSMVPCSRRQSKINSGDVIISIVVGAFTLTERGLEILDFDKLSNFVFTV